jgi:hypothetical protein
MALSAAGGAGNGSVSRFAGQLYLVGGLRCPVAAILGFCSPTNLRRTQTLADRGISIAMPHREIATGIVDWRTILVTLQ